MGDIKLTIDNIEVTVPEGSTLLDAAHAAGIDIPTLCYLRDVNEIGACRMCLCEVEGARGLVTACAFPVSDGMVAHTNTERLRESRRKTLQLIVSDHNMDCLACVRNNNCELQKLCKRYGVTDTDYYAGKKNSFSVDTSSKSIVRDNNKCILCRRCVGACENLQGIGVIGANNRGFDTYIGSTFDVPLAETSCVNCGQCRVFCPTGAISIKTHMDEVWDALSDPNVRVVAQVAPAVRVAVGDHYGQPKGRSVMGKIVNALHRMGFDEVYDTTFSADLTIMEESAEFLRRVEKGENLPLLTSCCPAWVKFVTDQYKEFIPNISTCRSPQQMMSAVIKEYFRDPENAQGKKIVMVSIMPCTAKKAEAIRPNSFTKGEQDTDIVITTTELIRMINNFGLDFAALEPEACDMPFGFGSGGGVIFGVTGGVTEAVLRRLSPEHTKEAMREISECGVRGDEGIKEFSVPYKGMEIKVCVTSGLANARTVMERVKNGEAEYHLIEVMACRRGCIMGGGQPTRAGDRTKAARAKGLYNADNTMIIKKSDENPLVVELYDTLLKGKEHELLHNEFY